ncbi:MAG: S9 family peptidase [Gemmatimonadota bacterium]
MHSIDWCPDGQCLLYLSREAPGKEEKRLKEEGGIRVVDGFVRMPQVWTVEVAGGQCRQLTRDRSAKAAARWSPDGRRIAFEQRPDPTANQAFGSRLYVMEASGKGKRRLTSASDCENAPRWSPDGQEIAYLRRTALRYPQLDELAMVPLRGGGARVLTRRLDRSVTEMQWAPDGRHIVAAVHDGMRQHLHAVAARGGRCRPLTEGDRLVSAPRLAGGRMAFLSESCTEPGEIHVAAPDGRGEERLTATNPQVKGWRLGRTRALRWKAPDGLEVEGVLVLPPDYRKGRALPLIVEPHGGPAGARTWGFYAGWQVLAGRGYAVLAPNFRGSAGYGQAFVAANEDDFGGGDFADVMSGVDALVEKGIADPRRLGIMGYSYGGYMTAWAIGQTDRFRAAVAGAGVTNLQSFYGTSDIQWFTRQYQRGAPWERAERYAAQSPITFVGRVKTPTLIYHGDEDRRVPMEQSEQLYVSLRERGVPTQLVRYPRAGHGLSEYHHRRDCLERIVAWLDRWVKPARARGWR